MAWRVKARGAFAIGLVGLLGIAATARAANGTWERAWGQDVIQSGHPGDAGTGFEVCAGAADCKAGITTGALGGEFDSADAVAVDPSGNVFVSDPVRNRIQEFSANGAFVRMWGKNVIQTGKPGDLGAVFEICTVAADCQAGTSGTLGGEMNDPEGIAVDGSGSVYVADNENNRIEEFDNTGHFITTWGKGVNGGAGFETCSVAALCHAGATGTLGGELDHPNGVAAIAGQVYVADANNERIQKYTTSGAFQRTWGQDVIQSGHAGDTGTGFEICTVAADCQAGATSEALGGDFDGVSYVAADQFGNVYTTDLGNGRVTKFDSLGNFVRSWGRDVVQTGKPEDNGNGPEICTVAADCKDGIAGGLGGEFGSPEGIATDSQGNVYVADQDNNNVQKFDSQGNFLRAWGKDVDGVAAGTGFEVCTVGANCQIGSTGGLGGEFNQPHGIAAGSTGELYVADTTNNRIQKFSDPVTSTPPGGSPSNPSNEFTVGALNGRKLTVNVASAGRVDLQDVSVNLGRATASAKQVLLKHTHAFGGPGPVTVAVKLTKPAKKILHRKGKVKVRAKITFAPSGGFANTQTHNLKVK